MTSFRITIPAQDGFIGRVCSTEGCRGYFKLSESSVPEGIYCPYCGSSTTIQETHTPDQMRYAQGKLLEHAEKEISRAVDKMLSGLPRSTGFDPDVRITVSSTASRARFHAPGYREKEVDSELRCPDCGFLFQVVGLFGFCPSCRLENQIVYDANLAILERDLRENPEDRRALRHAYSDLVSSFESYASRYWRRHADRPLPQHFQYPTDLRKSFRNAVGLDPFAALAADEWLVLRRVFAKRNVCIHTGGIANEIYVQRIPQDRGLLGKPVPLSLGEFMGAAESVRKAALALAIFRSPDAE